MKYPKGFRGRYFSLAAILAFSASVSLASSTASYSDSQSSLQKQDEYSEAEEETPTMEESPIVVISKKIKTKKSKVYSASKSYVSTTNLTDNVNVLTSQEIKLQGINTITEALNTLPGISFTRFGGLGKSTNVYLQGFANKYLLVLVDGVRYNDPTNTSGADLSQLMVDDIDRIEVIKGAQSGVWGADAAAGVVNIITKQAKPGNHANISVEAGSYKHRSLSTFLSHRSRKNNISLSVFRVTEDSFSAQAPNEKDLDQYEKDPYRNTTVNFKAGHRFDAYNKIDFEYHDINSLNNYDSTGPDTNQRGDYRAKSGYLRYKHIFGRNTLDTAISRSYFHNRQLDAVYGVDDSKGTTSTVEIKDTYRYGHKNILTVGTSYQKRKTQYTQVGYDEKSEDNINKAIYLNNIFNVNDFIFSTAVRYDYFSKFNNKLTGKAGVKYLINDNVNVYANIGSAYKTPNMMDMINIWGVSNFDLKPENIMSYNIGGKFYGLDVNLFRNEIKDMIVWNNALWPTPGKNINIDGTSVLKGVEISYSRVVLDRLLLGVNYTYTSAKDKNKNTLLRRPKYQIGVNATYSVDKNIVLNANGTYIGSRADKDFSTWPASDVDTGKYFVLNTKFDYKINKTWSTYLKINNLLDRIYQSVYGYGTARRSFYLGVSAKF